LPILGSEVLWIRYGKELGRAMDRGR